MREDHLRAADRPLHLVDLLDVGAAEAVDRLLGVTDDEQLAGGGLHRAPLFGPAGGIGAVGGLFG